jgi:hypothetical protein
MSPLHRRPNGVDKIIQDSAELRAQLTATVEELERFVAEFTKEIELEEQRCRKPGVGEDSE